MVVSGGGVRAGGGISFALLVALHFTTVSVERNKNYTVRNFVLVNNYNRLVVQIGL
jgi:hypothetical protein